MKENTTKDKEALRKSGNALVKLGKSTINLVTLGNYEFEEEQQDGKTKEDYK